MPLLLSSDSCLAGTCIYLEALPQNLIAYVKQNRCKTVTFPTLGQVTCMCGGISAIHDGPVSLHSSARHSTALHSTATAQQQLESAQQHFESVKKTGL